MWIFYVLLGIVALYLLYFFCVRKWINPYRTTMVFGKKGSGKSTLLTKLALQHLKKGWTVYSTEHTPGTFYIEPKQVGHVMLKPRSVLLLDEVSLLWGNRDFKTFDKAVEQFFRYARKYRCKIYMFSQTFDIDKKLRELCDQMYLVTNVLTVFSYAKKINKKIVLTLAESDRPSTIAENLTFDSFLLFWAGSRKFTFIPKYAKYFKSFNPPDLPEVELPYEEPYKKVRKKNNFCLSSHHSKLRPSFLERCFCCYRR